MIDLRTTDRVYLTVDEFRVIVGRSRRLIYYWIETSKLGTVQTQFGLRIPIAEAKRVAAYTHASIHLRASAVSARTTSVQPGAKTA